MSKFPKYNLGFLVLKGLSNAISLTSTGTEFGVWFLIFSIQVYMNCLNSSLMEGRAANMRATTGVEAISKSGFGVEICERVRKKGVGEPLLLVRAFIGILASLSSIKLAFGGGFYQKL